MLGTLAVGCDDDDTVAPVEVDASTGTDAPVQADTSTAPDVVSEKAKFSQFFAQILVGQVKNQPKAGLPDRIYPIVDIHAFRKAFIRNPDAVSDGDGPPPLGCVAFHHTTLDPTSPKGLSFKEGNMGPVIINGHTGGSSTAPQPNLDGGADADADAGPGPIPQIPKPIACQQFQPFPGFDVYGCNMPHSTTPFPPAGPGSFFPTDLQPVTAFIQASDTITFNNGAGTADVGAFKESGPLHPSSITNLTVTNDLHAITPAMIDGSAPFVFNYNCGGAPCTGADHVGFIIEAMDHPPTPDPYATPFPATGPLPQGDFTQIFCEDTMALHQSSYTISPALLKTISANHKYLFMGMLTTNVQVVKASDGTDVFAAAGNGVFGVTKRP